MSVPGDSGTDGKEERNMTIIPHLTRTHSSFTPRLAVNA